MSDDGLYKFERNGKAALTAGLAAVALVVISIAGIGGVASVFDKDASLCLCVCPLFWTVFGSPFMGVAGASARSLKRAGIVGAAIGGFPTAFLLLLFLAESLFVRGESLFLIGKSLPVLGAGAWLLALFLSLGSIIAQVGFLAGATAKVNDDEPLRLIQLTLRDFSPFFISLTIYFACLCSAVLAVMWCD